MIYVDHARLQFGRMLMNHLMADTHEELTEIADQLGLGRWIQKPHTPQEHLDVCEAKRREAIKLGVKPVEKRELVEVVRRKRQNA